MSTVQHHPLSTADTYHRLMDHDPTLMAALRSGDREVVDAVGRVLRLTPLRRLMADRAILVAALVSLPRLCPTLQATWRREDPVLTAQLFSWVTSRAHVQRPMAGDVAA